MPTMPTSLRSSRRARRLLALLCLATLAVPASALAGKHGVDVSHHQGRIRWNRVAQAGVDFAYIKATEGTDIRDPRFRENRERAATANLKVGAYHFARPSGAVKNRIGKDARKEAKFFLKVAEPRKSELVPVLDLETSGVLTRKELSKWTHEWIRHVRKNTGARVVIYSSPKFWSDRMRATRRYARSKHPLWLAHYTRKRPSVPARAWDGEGWTFWQWTNCGKIRGIKGCVDRNRFAGATLGDLVVDAPDKRSKGGDRSGKGDRPRQRSPRRPAAAGDGIVERIARLIGSVLQASLGFARLRA